MKQGHQNSDGWQDDNDDYDATIVPGNFLAESYKWRTREMGQSEINQREQNNSRIHSSSSSNNNYRRNFRIEGVEIEKQFSSQIHKPNHTH